MNQRCSVKYPENFAYLDRDNFKMKRPILKVSCVVFKKILSVSRIIYKTILNVIKLYLEQLKVSRAFI